MRNPDHVIIGLASKQDGVVSKAELLRSGVSSKTIYRRSRTGLLLAYGTGIYTVPPLANDRTPIRVAVNTVAHSAASHFSAARLHKMWVPSYHDPGVPEILVGRKRGADIGGAKVHETRSLPRAHITTIDGIPTTTPARTFRDIAFKMSAKSARHMAQRLIADQLATASELASTQLALARRGRAGTVFTRQLLDSILGDETYPMSELEIRARNLFDDHGLRCLKSQFSPPWRDGVEGIVDFADPVAKIIVEVDGRRWHSVQQQLDIDRSRDRLAQRNGWASARFNWTEVVHEGELVIEHITMLRRHQLAENRTPI